MLLKTHLAIAVAAILLFLPKINNKIVFIFVALIATMLPDIDSGFSTIGKFPAWKPFQFFSKHRGMIHSFSFCIFISLLLAVFWPVASLAFFLGYGLHLLADSFTKDGILAFWPYKKRVSGMLKVGSLAESSLFLAFILADVLLLLILLGEFF